jgi:PAS domain S-box-containing protein
MPVANTTPATLTDLLFEKVDAGVCLVGPDSTIVRANAEWLRSTGFTEDQVVGENIIDLFPATRDTAVALHARARAGHRVEVPRHTRVLNGRETWWEGSIEPVPMEGGTGLLITAREVTVLLRAPDAEAERRNSVLLRAVADSIPDPIFVKDTESRILFANPATLQVIGKPREQVIGKSDKEIYDDREVGTTVVATDRRIMESGQAISIEERIQTPAGYRFFLSTKAPFQDADGKVVGLVGVARDITERKRAEAVVRESETRYRQLFQNMLEGFAHCRMIFDEGGRAADFVYLDVNGAFERLTGLRNVVGKRVSEVIPGIREAHPELLETYGRVAREGTPEWFEIDFRPLGICLAISVYQPQPDHFVAVFDNITERKRVEEALRRSECLYRAIGESIKFGVWVCAPDGKNIYASESFLKLVGITQEQCSDFGWGDVLHPDDAELTIAAWKECVRTGGKWDIEHRFRGVDGKWHPVLARGVPVRNEAGEIICWAGIHLDISRLKEAEESLREVSRRKDEFIGMLSHELRNPLAPIRNSAYILQHAEPNSEQARRAPAVIQRQTEHLTRLVDDLLDVTRITHGKIELRQSRVDLREVVWRAADDFRLAMDERGVTFRIALPDAKLWANADETRITQVIGNLLHNASKFTRRGDDVALSLQADGGSATIRVTDTGAGIDATLLPHIFDAFVQGERTLARSEGGLGLGLALVKCVAEVHGGTVRADSAGKGKGSEFTVRLPLLTALASEAPPDPHPDRRNGGRRVLVVDDNTDAAESLADIVKMLGHYVEVAYDGPTAIEKARASPPNVVLCDIGLPGMSGHEVALALRASLNSVQLIAVSGYAQPEDVKRAIEAGFDGHVAKPCDPEKIERLLG